MLELKCMMKLAPIALLSAELPAIDPGNLSLFEE